MGKVPCIEITYVHRSLLRLQKTNIMVTCKACSWRYRLYGSVVMIINAVFKSLQLITVSLAA